MHGAPGGLVAGIRPENGHTAKAILSFTSPLLEYDRRDVPAQQEILRAKFAGVGWLVPQFLAAMPAAADFYFDSLSQVHMPQWYRGRTVLLGDARILRLAAGRARYRDGARRRLRARR
ncbi:hypothetical protein [Rugosimonospora africana]|uniref:Uncharacterized protein n=1 Tax=Rugosimonospora africana TaxID=556532 RepID=A0A8J3R4J1_9ACTN|nr:hypothetical protein [Rugosimonospora africana]GIH21563.1 hypothetical protein Raf01_97350 [Rugosimonospora africana]